MTTVYTPIMMSFPQRALLIAGVVFLHLALISSWTNTPELARNHHEMSVAFVMRASTPQLPQLTTGAALREKPRPIKQVAEMPPIHTAASPQTQPDIAKAPQNNAAIASDSSPSLPDREPDFQAAYLNNPAPEYPVVARRMAWQGRVVVSVEVLVDGRAGEVKLRQSSGHPVLDESAIQSVRNWRFTPARQAGQLVNKWFLVPIPFVLKEIE